jgi:capsular polysaccharide biosynthesis protein
MVRGDRFETFRAPQIFPNNIKKVSGRVAVIAQLGSTKEHTNYYHWIFEVLGRLAMLEMAGVEYDWLYVGKAKRFMKETLELWGINPEKIIEPLSDNFAVQADEIIIPSMVINTSCGHAQAGSFQHPVTSKYVKEKLLEKVLAKNIDSSKFSRRVFVSRKDAFNAKRILNEDEIFALFQEKGFERYELAKLSVVDQIVLFHNAEVVVSEQSSGLTNILFCKPNTVVVEIFQLLIDNCFWWVTYMCDLKYVPIMTLPTDVDYFADHRNKSYAYMMKAFFSQVNVPLDEIQKFTETL